MKNNGLRILQTFLLRILLGLTFLLGTIQTIASENNTQDVNRREISLYGKLKLIHYVLENGLQVAIVVDKMTPTFCFYTFYRVGAADEEEPGKIHFLEHLMFKAKNYSEGAFEKQVLLNGGQDLYAATTHHFTYFKFSFPKNKLDLAIELDAERSFHTRLTPDVIERERRIILAERTRLSDSATRGLVDELFSLVYNQPNYSIIGQEASIKAFIPAEIKKVYTEKFVPNNKAIVIVGNVNPDRAINLIKRKFDAVKSSRMSSERSYTNREQFGLEKHLKSKREINKKIFKVWLTPDALNQDFPALYVAGKLLNDGFYALINQIVSTNRSQGNYTAGLLNLRTFGLFSVYAELPPGERLEIAKQTFEACLEKLRSGDFSDDQIKLAKAQIKMDFYDRILNTSDLAYWLGVSFAHTGDPTAYLTLIDKTQQVWASDIQRVARQYLTDERAITVSVGSVTQENGNFSVLIIFGFICIICFAIYQFKIYSRKLQKDISNAPPKKNRSIIVFLTVFILGPIFQHDISADIPNHKIYYQQDGRVPLTRLKLVFLGAGTQQELENLEGLANLTAKMIMESARKPNQAHLRNLELLGTNLDIQVTERDFIISIKTFSENLERALAVAKILIQKPEFLLEDLTNQKKMTAIEYSALLQNDALNLGIKYVLKKYQSSINIQSLKALKNILLEDIEAYHRQLMSTEVLFFEVISDLEEYVIEKQLEIFTQKRETHGFVLKIPESKPILKQTAYIIDSDSAVDYCHWLLSSFDKEDIHIGLELLIDTIGKDNHSLVYRHFREALGWCYSPYAKSRYIEQTGYIEIFIDSPQQFTKKVIPEMRRYMRSLKDNEIFWQIFEDRKQIYLNSFSHRETPDQRIKEAIFKDLIGQNLSSQASTQNQIENLKKKDIEILLNRHFSLNNAIMIFWGDPKRLTQILNDTFLDIDINILSAHEMIE